MAENKILKSSIQAAFLNVISSIGLRLLTFVLNIVILRHITTSELGIINVRLTLLDDTIILISCEAFRRSCIGKPKDKSDWQSKLNLMWFAVPISIVIASIVCYTSIYCFELPDKNVEHYMQSVYLVCIGSIITVFSEPLWILCKTFQVVKLPAANDFIKLCFRSSLMVIIVLKDPENVIYWFGFAQFTASLLYTLIYYGYFMYFIAKCNVQSKKNDSDSDHFPFRSILDVLPSPKSELAGEERKLFFSFFLQGLLKWLLTEGEKIMMTVFNILNFSQQGIFDAVSNLGSLAARLVFRNIEESAYTYFCQTVKRGEKYDKEHEKEPSQNLFYLIRLMTLIGLIVVTFGFSYSHMLLHLYGGINLSGGIGPTLLRAQCLYILFIAINGITECYRNAAMTQEQVNKYNFTMSVMSVIFLGAIWVLSKAFGPVGFIFANCVNMGMRIVHNCTLITSRHHDLEVNPASGLFPRLNIVFILVLSGIVCQLSELYVYPFSNVYHFMIGASSFVAAIGYIGFQEQFIKNYVEKKVLKRNKVD